MSLQWGGWDDSLWRGGIAQGFIESSTELFSSFSLGQIESHPWLYRENLEAYQGVCEQK